MRDVSLDRSKTISITQNSDCSLKSFRPNLQISGSRNVPRVLETNSKCAKHSFKAVSKRKRVKDIKEVNKAY